jgi:hypothetical protein
MAMSFAGNYFNLSPEEVGKGFSPTFLGAQPIFDVNKIQPPSGNAEFSPELKGKLKDLSGLKNTVSGMDPLAQYAVVSNYLAPNMAENFAKLAPLVRQFKIQDMELASENAARKQKAEFLYGLAGAGAQSLIQGVKALAMGGTEQSLALRAQAPLMGLNAFQQGLGSIPFQTAQPMSPYHPNPNAQHRYFT